MCPGGRTSTDRVNKYHLFSSMKQKENSQVISLFLQTFLQSLQFFSFVLYFSFLQLFFYYSHFSCFMIFLRTFFFNIYENPFKSYRDVLPTFKEIFQTFFFFGNFFDFLETRLFLFSFVSFFFLLKTTQKQVC